MKITIKCYLEVYLNCYGSTDGRIINLTLRRRRIAGTSSVASFINSGNVFLVVAAESTVTL